MQLCLIHHQQYLNSLINNEMILADTEGIKQVNPNIFICTIREGVAFCDGYRWLSVKRRKWVDFLSVLDVFAHGIFFLLCQLPGTVVMKYG